MMHNMYYIYVAGLSAEILEMAAVARGKHFREYIMPTQDILPTKSRKLISSLSQYMFTFQ